MEIALTQRDEKLSSELIRLGEEMGLGLAQVEPSAPFFEINIKSSVT